MWVILNIKLTKNKQINFSTDSEGEMNYNVVYRRRNKRKHNCISNTRKENLVKRMKGQKYLWFSTTEGDPKEKCD